MSAQDTPQDRRALVSNEKTHAKMMEPVATAPNPAIGQPISSELIQAPR